MPRAFPLLIAATLAFCFAAPASAQMLQRERERVYYGDLDLYNTADAEVLLDRVDNAAYRVCGGEEARANYEWDHVADCSEESTARAVRQLDSPVVTALHDGLEPEVIIEADEVYPYPVK